MKCPSVYITPFAVSPTIGRSVPMGRRVGGGKGHVINYGEGRALQNGKIVGLHLFVPPPPPSRQGKTFCAPSFKGWTLFAHPHQYG